MEETAVRPYLPSDRPAVEDVSQNIELPGEAGGAFWTHRASSIAVWLAPYLDSQPESTLVATLDGRIVGYLTGCVDTSKFAGPDTVMAREIARHRLMFRRGAAGFLWRAMFDTLADRLRGRPQAAGELHDPRWPSHLHINLLAEARGRGLGRMLMDAWIARLREVGAPGCHLGAIAENTDAIGFFSAMGFVPHGQPTLIAGMRGRSGGRLHQQMMVRSL